MGRLWQAARRRLLPRRPQPVILMYHRVATVTRDPWELAVPPALFEAQMRFLREERTVLSMEALVEGLQRGDLPRKAVAVTFDDGYRDNLVHAKPSLERHGIPATLFVATGLIGCGRLMWWDMLADAIFCAPEPENFALPLGNSTLEFKWGRPERGDARTGWKGWEPAETARQSCFQTVWRALKASSTDQREGFLEELQRHLPVTADPLAFPMAADELELFRAGGLVTLAPHTVSHASLPALTVQECEAEIAGSVEACAALQSGPVQGFAYPYGDFDELVADAVRRAGLGWACTTSATPLQQAAGNLFRLPRVGASTMSIGAFKRQLVA